MAAFCGNKATREDWQPSSYYAGMSCWIQTHVHTLCSIQGDVKKKEYIYIYIYENMKNIQAK